MVFHIDGNSFYASCERVFRPDLYRSPIAVLTNNDGIIIALNAECKALGFKRGDVFYKVRDKLEESGVAVFSSNYTLYADMSARMNLIYNRFAPDVEVYSIDESFLFFPAWTNTDYTVIGNELRRAVTKETGIPVSIGIAPNKTLAKMCNKLAKKQGTGASDGANTSGGGVCDWSRINQDEELRKCPVEDIWGIGQSKAELLKRQGVTSALALKNYPLISAKKHLSITGFKTVQELNGIRAIDRIEEAPRQAVSVSRSFKSAVYELDDIITALAEYTQEAVKRMRAERLACRCVSVYLLANIHAGAEQYANQMTAELPCLSSYLPEIQAMANDLLKRIFRPNHRNRRVMISLTGLVHDENPQLDLFNADCSRNKQLEPLMRAFDTINDKYGRGTIKLACGLGGKKPPDEEAAPWKMKRDYLSPRYTTNIREIPVCN